VPLVRSGKIYSRTLRLGDIALVKDAPLPAWVIQRMRPQIMTDTSIVDEWDSLFVFKLITCDVLTEGDPEFYGLLLKEVDIPGTYQRVDLVKRIPESWIDSDVSPTVITLI